MKARAARHRVDDEIELQRTRVQTAPITLVRALVGSGPPGHMRAVDDRSPMGGMLERARLGTTTSGGDWQRGVSVEEHYVRYALLDGLWRELAERVSAFDLAVHEALYRAEEVEVERTVPESELLTPGDVASRQGGLCLEGLRSGGLCRNPLALDGDGKIGMTCKQHVERVPPMATGRMTAQREYAVGGARVIDDTWRPVGRRVQGVRIADEIQAVRWYEDAPLVELEGYQLVRGWRVQEPSHRDAARTMLDGFTLGAARALCSLERVPVELRGHEADQCGWLREWCDDEAAIALIPTVTERMVRSSVQRFNRVARQSDFFRLLYVAHEERFGGAR